MIENFILIINLRMIDSKHAFLDHLNLADLLSEFQNNVQVSIHYYISRDFKTALNVLKKQLCKLNHNKSFTDKNKQHIFCNTTYYDQNVVIFLTVF